jgi:hypothetical protein
MSAPILARALLTAIAAGQGLAPLFIDLNRTHATNPLWPGHARFHVVWQTFTQTLIAAAGIAILWWPNPANPKCFYLAALLVSIPLAAFLVAMFTRTSYGGALHDTNGIQPVRIRTAHRVIEFDLNAVIVLLAAALVVLSLWMFSNN